MQRDKILRTLLLASGLAASIAYSEEPWYQLRKKTHANFYDIQKSHTDAEEERDTMGFRELTRILQPNQMPLREGEEPFEDEESFQYQRWAAIVEPRAAPSGDLALLDSGQQVMADLALTKTANASQYGAWESLGPDASGTYGAGRLDWIAFHPTDPKTFMVGSPSGGLWMTQDGGSTWSTTTDQIAVLGVAWAVYDPSNPSTIYLGTGDGDHGDTHSVGVLKSTDGGATWNTTGLSYAVSSQTEIEKLVIDPKNPQKLFVATSNGLQVSSDGAATFKAATGINGKVWDLEINPGDSNIVYATTTSFYVSQNGGASFTRNGNVPTAGFRMQIAVSAAKPGYVYALQGAEDSTQGVYRSTDSGQTFSQTGSGSAIGCTQTWYDYGFDANPTNANQLTASCLEAFQSQDGGASWAQMGSSYHVDVHGTIYREDGTLYNVDDGGIFLNTGTTKWTNLNNNLVIGQVYRIGIYPGDYDQICTGRQDNATDIRNASTGAWKSAISGDGFGCFWNSTGTRWYGESEDGAGEGCNYANGTVSGCKNINISAEGTWDNPWAADPNSSTGIFNARTTDMWHSTNNGSTWTQMGTIGGSGSITNFVVAPSNSNVLYVFKGGAIYTTTNQGANWQNVKGSVSGTVVNGTVSDSNPNDVWVTASGYTAANKIFHSTDGGANWSNQTLTGLPNLPADCAVLDNLQNHGIYVGMDVGVYYKNDSLSSWLNYSAGLPNASVPELKIGQKGASMTDRRLIAATFGRSVWSTALYGQTPTFLRGQARLPDLDQFSAVVNGSILDLRFQLESSVPDLRPALLQIAAVDGKILYHEQVPSQGAFERHIDLTRTGKGLYLFMLKQDGRQISRRIVFQ